MVKRKLFDWAMDSQNTDGRYYIIQSCSQRWWHEALTYFQDGKVKGWILVFRMNQL